jgi:hypothetical protein
VLVLNNDLAVDDGRAAIKLNCCLCDSPIALAPIEAVAGVSASFAALDDQEGTVSVMLDLVDPSCTPSLGGSGLSFEGKTGEVRAASGYLQTVKKPRDGGRARLLRVLWGLVIVREKLSH